MEGTLAGPGLTRVLHDFRSQRQSGVLHVDYDGAKKRVYFKNGNIVFASSDVAGERLGEILVRAGKLKPAERDLACKVRESSHLRLGKTLVDMGYMSDSDLDRHLKAQVEAILHSLKQWHSGSYRTELKEEPFEKDDEDLARTDISTENILLDAARDLEDAEAIRATIGDIDEPLRFAKDPAWIGQNLRLTPEEGFLLSRVDGQSSASEIAKLSPMGEDETLRSICGLVMAGVLESEGPPKAAEPARPPSAAPASPVTPKAASPRPAETPRSTIAPEPPPKPANPKPIAPEPPPRPATPRPIAVKPPPKPANPVIPGGASELSPEAAKFRDEMVRKHATAHQATYYELLDVKPTASVDEIKAAYFRLAKRLHPDHRAGLKIRDPEGIFDDLYLAIKAAYEVLSRATERRRYDFSLEQKAAAASRSGTASEPGKTDRAPTKPAVTPQRTFDAQQMARLHYANGQRFFGDGRFHEAIEELQDAVRLDGGRAEYHRLLGRALAKNPKWRRRAEAHFLKVLELDRFDIDTMIALGEVYEAGGMGTRARKLYEEALGLDPGNPRALDKLGRGAPSTTMDKLKGMLHRTKGH